MKCRYCGNELRSGERFCRKCGKPAEAEPVQSPRFCIECGAELLPNAGFCRSCGAPVSQQKPEQPQQPNAAQTDEKAELKRRTEILVIAAQGGDSESFAKLYELYHQKVFALAKTTVKSDADAEDVLQMTFIKAWDHLDRLKDTSAFSTWIQRITLNQCYSLLRKQHATIPIDNNDEDSEPIQIESDLMLPEVYAEQNDLKKRLGKIIDELSDVQKQTITLYYFDGLPVENIAWIMDCSVNTVKSRLFLARKSIKTEIEEQERKSGQPFYGIVGLATIPFGQFFVAHVKASSLSQTAASALLKAIAGKISQSASAAAKAGSSAAAKGAAKAGAKTAAAAGTKAAAGAGAKTAAAVSASVSKKVIAGIVAGTLAVGTVAGGTVATIKIVQNNRERKAAESATTVVTDGTFPSVTASDPFLPQDPSGGLSAQEPEAYQAYLEHLEQNKPGIDGYKNVFDYSDDDSTDPENYPMPRAVALFDVCGDAIPELIYINEGRKDAHFGTIYNLNVLTYRDGSLVSVYRDEWDYNSYWDEMITYYLFADPTSKTMYFFEDSSMSNYVLKEYSAFTETESGHLQRSKIMFHEEEYDEDSEKTTVVYNVNGKNVSEADFRKEVERLQANAVYLIPRPGEFREPENAQYIAMTCDEMIAYLQGLLNPQAPSTPVSEAELHAAYKAYLECLLENKDGIDAYFWQLHDWGAFYHCDEDHAWRYYLSDEPLTTDARMVPRPVAFYDISGDGLPELFYIGDAMPNLVYDEGSDSHVYHYESSLHILTYRNGQILSLYSGEWDDPNDWELDERTLSICPNNTLYSYGCFSGMGTVKQYDVFTTASDGLLRRELALCYIYSPEDVENPPPPYIGYFGAGEKEITEQEYRQREQSFQNSTRLFGYTGNGDLAMTADEAIAWLRNQLGVIAEAPTPTAAPPNTPTPKPTKTPKPTATPTKKPTATPVQSAGSSSNEREAYQAYIDVLMKNKKAIDSYTWQRGYYGNEYESLTDDNLARPVVICDVCGDSLPELIFYRTEDPNEDHPWVFLTVVTYRDGKAKTIYTDSDEVRDWYDEDDYCYYQQKNDKALRMRYSYGDEDGETLEYYIFSENGNGSLERKEVSGNKAASSQIGQILMTSFENTHDDPLFEHLAAMTCDEAIACLYEQISKLQ